MNKKFGENIYMEWIKPKFSKNEIGKKSLSVAFTITALLFKSFKASLSNNLPKPCFW